MYIRDVHFAIMKFGTSMVCVCVCVCDNTA